ncbi:S-layer homology domain-containing protein [Paenibacillus sp. UNCCL117]|uniref:S-layer homology domain-containing protein n=1 Tax=unclassified Paenibacillus TaxID=185978 RepID=UPI000891F449|nr:MULTISPECIES: S-layer homology domain-containing protein [unclassified Paenibacillus]SDC48559.1 S-layer homology domain-containing protein [Paenibacillus sp. cl123]SFW11914.1 S-layer homology domain-containing protein [Paenibacillus sp. UNCCL117]
MLNWRYKQRINDRAADGRQRKVWGAAIALLLLTGGAAGGSAWAASFTDIPSGAWYEQELVWAVERQAVFGYEDGTFRPGQPVKESEFVTMLLRAASAKVQAPAAGESWYMPYYNKAVQYGLPVEAAENGMALELKRGRVAVLIAAFAGQAKMADEASAIRFLLDTGLSQGKTAATPEGFAADQTLTRAEAVTFVRSVIRYAAMLAPPAAPNAKPGTHDKPAGQGSGSRPRQSGEAGAGSGSGPVQPGGSNGSTGGQKPDPSPTDPPPTDPPPTDPPPTRPQDPGTSSDTGVMREERLQQAVAALGLTMETTGSGYKLAHPAGTGSGVILTRTDETSGELQLLDTTQASLVRGGYALLRSAGITASEQQLGQLIEQVQASGNSMSLKIGRQILTVIRSVPSGSITVRYTISK